jgi:kynureninase
MTRTSDSREDAAVVAELTEVGYQSRMTRSICLARDAADVLAPLRHQFAVERLDDQGVIYLDGNSLGILPRATASRLRTVVEDEWGLGLIRSWNSPPRDKARSGETGAAWITLSARVADKIAALIGADPGEVGVGDSTSVNLYKVLSVAAAMARADSGGRRLILSERENFPSDLYIADAVARGNGLEPTLVEESDIAARLDERVAILLLTHVNYRTGRMHDMAAVTRAARDAGAIVVWDLSHSAGAVPVHLHGRVATDAPADFAVGCGYKYLNGGPGAPAFLWVHPRHTARMEREDLRQPLAGWLGHASPFAFAQDYQPGAGIARFTCGTPAILSLAALDCGVDTVLAADRHGGLPALWQKSTALTELFIALVESRCAGHGLRLVSPRTAGERGCQVSFASSSDGYAVMQALIARGVIGDFRAPDIIRFGFPPLYTRFVDVWDAVERLDHVLSTGEWREPRFAARMAVT